MNRWAKVLIAALFIVFCFALVGQTPATVAEPSLKALIVTGQSNPWHNWEISSPILKQLLEQTALFKVDTATAPPGNEGIENFKPDFAVYDVVVLDYDGYDRQGWSEQTKTEFVEYVKSGGGVVVYHSANNSFPKWKQYNEIIGLGGWGGRNEKSGPMVRWREGKVVFDNSPGNAGSHGPAHPFQVVNRSSNHPITRDLPQKWMHAKDELYGELRGPAKNLTVLATAYSDPAGGGTGEHEPVLFTINYGKGRVFHTTLSHAKEPPLPAMECVGFIVTFQRGAEWAATGEVTQKVPEDFPTATEVRMRKGFKPPSPAPATPQLQALDELLGEIATYEFGQSRENLTKLTDIIRESYDSAQLLKQFEKRLLEFLRSDATLASKQFICRRLSIIGTEEAVPTLAAMLTQPETSDIALYALERIPGTAVDKALRNVLDKTSGKVKVGIINSLGERGDEAAAIPLSGILSDTDKEVAQAAAAALGKIAGPTAAAELGNALRQASGDWRVVLADAYLACADKFATSENKNAAMAIYKKLYTPAESAPIRSAALAGIVAATPEPEEAAKLLVDVLKGNEPAMQAVAISLVRRIPGTKATQAVVAELPNLSARGQVQLLSALADRGDSAALPAVVTAAKAEDEAIRIAALKAMASLGDASTVIPLAQTAAVTEGAERRTARESLYRLSSSGVNETIVEHIPQADPKVKVELIRSIGQRNIREALQALMKTAQDPDYNVRLESIKVLKDIAKPEHIPALVDTLIKTKSETELREAEKTVLSVARKSAGEGTTAVLKAIDSVKDVSVRCALLRILGGLGDSRALVVLRTALEDDNGQVQTAAIRALGDWPNAEPIADLLKVAQTSDEERHQVLALRGYVRLIGLDSDRSNEETIKMYGRAMSLAAKEGEKKLVLAGLANTKGIESLEMAAAHLDDKALQQEAGAAVVRIAESTFASNPDKTKAALKKVLKTTKSNSLHEQARKLINKINPP